MRQNVCDESAWHVGVRYEVPSALYHFNDQGVIVHLPSILAALWNPFVVDLCPSALDLISHKRHGLPSQFAYQRCTSHSAEYVTKSAPAAWKYIAQKFLTMSHA